MTAGELEMLDLGYAPPYSGVYDPLLIAARETAKRVLDPTRQDGAPPPQAPIEAGTGLAGPA